MSMMARFVAVAPARLDQVKRSPDLTESLFAPPDVSLERFQSSPALQERFRNLAPQMLRGTLERMQPELRAQLMRSFGIGEADLDSPGLGDAILKRTAERAAALRQPAQQKGKPEGKSVSLDKAWHGLHYLLCGAAEPAPGPLGQAVLGGTEIGEDLGYGPARCFTAAQTSEMAQALRTPGLEATLRARFNPAEMTSLSLYPGGWEVNGVDWLIEAFLNLRDFYAAAATKGQAVITVIE